MPYCLGRRKPTVDKRTLRFTDYLVKDKVTLEPPPVDWYSEVYNWPMYGNDTLGDCTIAGWGHLLNLWTKYSTGIEGGPTESQVIDAYKELSPNDDGADMLTVLKYANHTGIGGKKIAAYVALEPGDVTQAQLCIEIFGAVYIGLALPDAIANAENMLAIPWDVPDGASTTSGEWAPNENSGHAIISPGYLNPAAHFPIVTWGQMAKMSQSFYRTYSDEAYGVVSADWIKLNGISPSGYNLRQLLADRALITVS